MAKFPGLKADKREIVGRKVKQLRRQGIVPANLFGKKISSISIQTDAKTFQKIFDEVGETGIVEIELDDKKYPSLITGMAVDPVSGQTLHVDFHYVSLKEKVTAAIPVELTGEAPAVKEVGAVLSQNVHELEVEALPTDLPESIQVDISSLKAIGDVITVADLKAGEGIEFKVEPETVLISATEPAPEEVVEEAPEVKPVETTEQAAPAEAPTE